MRDLITKIDFFSGLDEKVLKRIEDACIMRQYTRNETIVRQGEMGLGVYVISRGKVKVEREQAGSRTQLAELLAEQCFGEMSLLDNKPRAATVTAIEDTECLLLTRDSFVRLMNKYPEIPIRMARVLAERVRVANDTIGELTRKLGAQAPAAPAQARAETASGSAGAGAPQVYASPAAPAGENGTANGTKAKIQKTLLDTFESLYTMKAMTRLSVAVLGCPVEGRASNTIEEIRCGDVKALFFPAEEPVRMTIDADRPGDFTLHVFTPGISWPVRFGPLAIEPHAPYTLQIMGDGATLERFTIDR
jgi:CRP-like cAMP-binding protein